MIKVPKVRPFTCSVFGFETTTDRIVEAIGPEHAACQFRRTYDWYATEWPDERQVTVLDQATGRVTHWVVGCRMEPVYEARPMKSAGNVK